MQRGKTEHSHFKKNSLMSNYETSDLLCTDCFNYVHEDNTTTDEDDLVICLHCAEEKTCYECGTITNDLVPFDGHQVCKECKSILIS